VTQTTVELRFADGSAITQFHKFTQSERFTSPLDQANFVLQPSPETLATYLEKTRKGDGVQLLVDGKPQAWMMNQCQKFSGSAEGGQIVTLDCLSPLKQLFEATADPKLTKSLQADAPFIDLVNEAIKPFDIGTAFSDDDVAPIRSKTGKAFGAKASNVRELKYQEAQVQPNEPVYTFLMRIGSRLGLLLRPGSEPRKFYVTRPHYEQDTAATVVLGKSSVRGNRACGDYEVVDTNEMQYEFCEIVGSAPDATGETRANVPKARVLSTEINSARPPFRPGNLCKYKPLITRDTESRDKNRARSAALLSLGLKAENAFYVRCKVDGFVSLEGQPWTVDTLCRVVCEAYGLDEVMWLSERTFSLSPVEGKYTELVFVPRGYVVLGEET
jgi:prophage tail gpP-like protein